MSLTYSRVNFAGIVASGRDPAPPVFVECATIPGNPDSGIAICDVTGGFNVALSLTMADLLVAAGVPPAGVSSPYGPVYYYVKCEAGVEAPDVATLGCYDPVTQGPWLPGTSSCGLPANDEVGNTMDVSGGTGVWFGGPEGLDATHVTGVGPRTSFVRFLAWMVNPTVHPDAIDTLMEGVTEFSVGYVLPASTAFLFHELPTGFAMSAASSGDHAPLAGMVMQLFVLAPIAPAVGERGPGAFTAGPAVAGVLRETHRVVGSAKVGVSAAGASWDGFSDGVGSATPGEAQSGVVRR